MLNKKQLVFIALVSIVAVLLGAIYLISKNNAVQQVEKDDRYFQYSESGRYIVGFKNELEWPLEKSEEKENLVIQSNNKIIKSILDTLDESEYEFSYDRIFHAIGGFPITLTESGYYKLKSHPLIEYINRDDLIMPTDL